MFEAVALFLGAYAVLSSCMSCSGSRQYSNWFHHYTVKAATTWNNYARENLTGDQVTADRKAHQKTHDKLTALKNWMQRRYQEEADLELEILQRIWDDDCYCCVSYFS